MLLHELMDEAVGDISADLTSLTADSRRRGLSLRRRRRALATVGTAAAATVLAAGVWAVAAGSGGPDSSVATDTPSPEAPPSLSGETAPITDRGVAAALAGAVDDVADGALTRFQGYAEEQDAVASLLLRPTSGTGPAGEVMLNLQPLAMAGDPPYSCNAGYLRSMTACAVRTLPGGDTLRTYRDDGDSEYGAASQRVVAEVISPERRLRVVVYAMNTNPWNAGDYREQTVLDTDQLVGIATLPWWSRTVLPREYVDAGERLEDFS